MNNEAKVVGAVSGVVTSDKSDKTCTVTVTRREKHPLYGKYIKRSTKLRVHDEENTCREGDTILVQQCRPYSKHKTWALVKVLARAEGEAVKG